MQCQNRIFNLIGAQATAVDKYRRIDGLINPVLWVEADANRRVFFYVDSIVVSME